MSGYTATKCDGQKMDPDRKAPEAAPFQNVRLSGNSL